MRYEKTKSNTLTTSKYTACRYSISQNSNERWTICVAAQYHCGNKPWPHEFSDVFESYNCTAYRQKRRIHKKTFITNALADTRSQFRKRNKRKEIKHYTLMRAPCGSDRRCGRLLAFAFPRFVGKCECAIEPEDDEWHFEWNANELNMTARTLLGGQRLIVQQLQVNRHARRDLTEVGLNMYIMHQSSRKMTDARWCGYLI